VANESIAALIEQLAGAVLISDAQTEELNALEPLLVALDRALVAAEAHEGLALLRNHGRGFSELKSGAPAEALGRLSQAIALLQTMSLEPSPAAAGPTGVAMAALPRTSPAPAPEPIREPPPAARPVARDEQTLELVRDFLQEAGDGLCTADEILLHIESAGLTTDKVNALFRVFHTIKGVAGFLELTEIVGLSHVTESLMNDVRDAKRSLAGDALDAVFASTALLRKLLEGVKRSVEAGVEFAASAETPPLVKKIEVLLALPEEVPASSAHPTPQPLASTPSPKPVAPPTMPSRLPCAALSASASSAAPTDSLSAGPTVVAPSNTRGLAPGPNPSAPLPPASAPNPSAPYPASSAPRPSSPDVGGNPAGTKLRETVKVDLERVDSMVEMIGELIIVESMLVHAPEIAGLASLRIRNTLSQLGKISRDLQNAAMRMRTVPVHSTFQKMARLTREVARKAGREVVLSTSGDGTEMDRAMVERLEDPLVHMVRNAVDHGIEPVAERVAAGKAAIGTLTLSASHKGGSIIIELTDDGRGLQRDTILRKAIEKGLVRHADALTDNEIFNLIFAPGFSTAAVVTNLSGRGVGMDVVKRNIEGMRGRIVITSEPGKGTTFRLVLPLTLAIIDGMLVNVGAERYLIPSLSIVETIQLRRGMLSSMSNQAELLTVRGQVMPLLRLSKLLEISGAKVDPMEALVVVVESVGKRVGLLVDQVVAQQQVVIKALGQGVGKAEYYSGAAILSDGVVGLILNVDRICALVTYRHHVQRNDSRNAAAPEEGPT
jgi:two-component system chemotaxis sensor kinase CheA